MIDNTRFVARIRSTAEMLRGENIITYGGIQFVAVPSLKWPFGISHYANNDCKGFYTTLRNDQIIVKNSLQKAFKGNNHSDFTFSEINKCIEEIELTTGIKACKFKVTNFEFGLNIIVPIEVEKILECITAYKKNYNFDNMKSGSRNYGKKCSLSEYAIKIYDKVIQTLLTEKHRIQGNVLRIEIEFKKTRRSLGINTLEDFRNPQKLIGLIDKLKAIINKVTMVGNTDFTNISQEERAIYFAGLNPNYWKTEKKMNKDKGKSKKLAFDKIANKITTVNYKDTIMQLIDEKFKKLLDS